MASGLCAALTGRTHGCTDQPANVKKTLANSEPSTHGTKRTCPLLGAKQTPASDFEYRDFKSTPPATAKTADKFGLRADAQDCIISCRCEVVHSSLAISPSKVRDSEVGSGARRAGHGTR